MTDWYYADAHHKQQGPVSAADIRALYQQGVLNDHSLVWCEGMENWQPLKTQSEGLELVRVAPPAVGGVDLRHDIRAIETGTAPLPGTAGGTYSRINHTIDTSTGNGIVYAGFWRRFAASTIDGFLTSIAAWIILIPLALVFGMSAEVLLGLDGAGPGLMFMLLQYAISIGLPALYFGWMQSSSTQASLGKMAVGIKVCRPDGETMSFLRSLGRYFAYFLFVTFTCGLGLVISALMIVFTQRKQALHDMICDTLVVDKWAFTEEPEKQKHGLDAVTIVVLVLYGLFLIAVIAGLVLFGAAIAAAVAAAAN